LQHWKTEQAVKLNACASQWQSDHNRLTGSSQTHAQVQTHTRKKVYFSTYEKKRTHEDRDCGNKNKTPEDNNQRQRQGAGVKQ
jgi:hypothetical protein